MLLRNGGCMHHGHGTANVRLCSIPMQTLYDGRTGTTCGYVHWHPVNDKPKIILMVSHLQCEREQVKVSYSAIAKGSMC